MTKFDYNTVVPSGIVGLVSTYTYGVSSKPSDLENKVLEMRDGFRNMKHNMNTRNGYTIDSIPVDGYTQQHTSDTSGMGRSRVIGGEDGGR